MLLISSNCLLPILITSNFELNLFVTLLIFVTGRPVLSAFSHTPTTKEIFSMGLCMIYLKGSSKEPSVIP